jgi:hypothetical protein
MEGLIERIKRLLAVEERDPPWADDVKLARAEIEQERDRAQKLMDDLDEADFDLEMAEDDFATEAEGDGHDDA